MINVNLPQRPDREALLAFWASASLLVGAALAVVALVAGSVSPAGALLGGAVGAGLVFLIGRSNERRLEAVYRRWSKATRAYADWARKTVAGIWYWTVFTAVGPVAGGKLSLDESPWGARGTLPDGGYGDPGDGATGRQAMGGLRDFAGWAVRSGRGWTLALLPLLGLLRALDAHDAKASAADIYTLY
jgi:hypothetical protein